MNSVFRSYTGIISVSAFSFEQLHTTIAINKRFIGFMRFMIFFLLKRIIGNNIVLFSMFLYIKTNDSVNTLQSHFPGKRDGGYLISISSLRSISWPSLSYILYSSRAKD